MIKIYDESQIESAELHDIQSKKGKQSLGVSSATKIIGKQRRRGVIVHELKPTREK